MEEKSGWVYFCMIQSVPANKRRKHRELQGTNCRGPTAVPEIWLEKKLRYSEICIYDSGTECTVRNMARPQSAMPRNLYLRLEHGELCPEYGSTTNCDARKLVSMARGRSVLPKIWLGLKLRCLEYCI